MKLNKIIGTLALSLGLGILSPMVASSAANPIPTNQNYIINNDLAKLENYDLASASEVDAYIAYLDQSKTNPMDIHKAETLAAIAQDFGNEYKLRLELAKSIKSLEKLDPVRSADFIKESIDILNSDKLDKISKQELLVKTYIIEKQDALKAEKNLDDYKLSASEEKELENQVKSYLDQGLLIAGGTEDLTTKLSQAEQAIQNSKSYLLADDETKYVYDDVVTTLKTKENLSKTDYELLVKFLEGKNKKDFEDHKFIESSELLNTSFNASNEDNIEAPGSSETSETTIENPAQNAETEANANSSAFLNNDKTSTRYNELTDPLKRELDAIDTDNNGILSDAELDNSANYSSDIDKDSWLYPFTEKGQNEGGTTTDNQTLANTESTSEQIGPEQENNTEAQPANQNENRQIPETVTIDNNATRNPELADNTDNIEETEADDDTEDTTETNSEPEFDNDSWDEAEAASNTEAASIVKTGIRGLGTIVVVLLVAVLAYFILNNKNKRNHKN